MDPKLFYLRWDRNFIGLVNYGHYLHNGGGELVNSLDDVGMGVVFGLADVIAGIPISQWSSMTSWWLINFNVLFRFIVNRHDMRRSTTNMGG